MSSDGWNRYASTVTVLPITRTKHDLPTRIEIEPDARNGLTETSYARCEDVRSVSHRRLVQRLGAVDELLLRQVAGVLRRFLEL